MTKELPSFTAQKCPILPSHVHPGRGRALGWLASTSVAALLVSALGALAMTRWETAGEAMGSEEEAVLVMLPAVASIDAISEPTPDVADQAPSEEVKAPDAEDVPDTPDMTEAPEVPDEAPVIEEIVADEMPEVDNEPPPAPVVEVPRPKERPKNIEKPKEKKQAEKPKEKKPREKVAEAPKKKASESQAAAKASSQSSKAQASAGSGTASSKNYGALIAKKVKSTRKKSAGERGSAVVSFTVSDNGGLAGVRIAKGSGSAVVDAAAMDHIQRSAPFPPPPAGATRTFSLTVKVN